MKKKILAIALFTATLFLNTSAYAHRNVFSEKNIVSTDVKTQISSDAETAYYVSMNAKKNGDGSFENPFSSFKNAVIAMKEITRNGMSHDITVYLRGGEYFFDSPYTFTSEDSGKNGFKIIYKSYDNEQAIFTASKKISGWKHYKDGIYMTSIQRGMEFFCMFEDNRFAIPARVKNVDWDNTAESWLVSDTLDNISDTNIIKFKKGDIPYALDISNAVIHFNENHVNWADKQTVAGIDYRNRTISLKMNETVAFQAGTRYNVFGCLEFLDAEGEYYIDSKKGILYYKPYAEDIKKAEVKIPYTNQILAFEGSEEDYLENIRFEDILFEKTDAQESWTSNTENAVKLNNVSNIEFIANEFNLIGVNAIRGMGHCDNVKIKDNYFHNIGSNAVFLTPSDNGPEKSVSVGSEVINNYFYDIGCFYVRGNAISFQQTDKTTVTNNTIRKVTRSAIAYGGPYYIGLNVGQTINGVLITKDNAWEMTPCRDNYFAYNDMSDCMTDSNDGGIFYSFGVGTGNIVNNNYIHDCDHPLKFAFAYYIDNDASYQTITNNIVSGMSLNDENMNSAIEIKGRDQYIENNFFVNNTSAQCAIQTELQRDVRIQQDIVFVKNIVSNSGEAIHGQYSWSNDRYKTCDYNLYYNDSGEYKIYNDPNVKNIEEWKARQTDYGYLDANTVINENPNFIDEKNGDFRLKYDSPAFKVGIKDIDICATGVTKEFPFDVGGKADEIYLSTDMGEISANVRLNKNENSKITTDIKTDMGTFYKDEFQIKYESKNPDVAFVSDDGVITAKASGISEIEVTVYADGKEIKKSLWVIVDDDIVEINLSINDTVIEKNKTTSVFATGITKNGFFMTFDNIKYSVLDEKTAKISTDGKVTALASGKTDIIVKASADGKEFVTSKEIKILDSILDKVSVTMEKVDGLFVGDEQQVNVEALMSDGSFADLQSCDITYSFDDEDIIEVSDNGVVKIKGSGKASVTAAVSKDGITRSASIKVNVYDKREGIVPEGWKTTGIGDAYGYVDFKDGKYNFKAYGWDVIRDSDSAFYMYRDDVKTDKFSVIIDIESMDNFDNNNGTVGIMLRDSLYAGSKMFNFRLRPDSAGLLSVWRNNENEAAEANTRLGSLPVKSELKLERNGKELKLYSRQKGEVEWKLVQNSPTTLSDECLVGVAVFTKSKYSADVVLNSIEIIK